MNKTEGNNAAVLIRTQAEQIRRMNVEEYLISKMGSDADGHNKRTVAGVSE